MHFHRTTLRHLALAGAMLVLPASAQQPAPPAAPPAAQPPAAQAQPAPAQPKPPAAAAVLAPAADAKVMVVGSVVQLRSGGPKMTIIELTTTQATTQWHQDSAGFKKETFPVAALKLSEDADDSDDDEDEDEDE